MKARPEFTVIAGPNDSDYKNKKTTLLPNLKILLLKQISPMTLF